MKSSIKFLFSALSVLTCSAAWSQSTTCPWVNAGPDATICAPNCTTLTATFLPTNQTNTYTISTIPYSPDPYTSGTLVPLSDDSWSPVINLPFTFCYYGTAYTQCVIGSNGALSFNLANANGYCQWPIGAAIPSTSDPMNTIMTPWQDLNPSVSGQIRYQTYGTAPCRRFVVSWNGVAMYSCGTPATQQVCLYETTNIIDNFIQTKPLCSSWNGGYGIQGLHNANGTQATPVPGRNYPTQWTATNDARRYTPNGANTYALTWLDGNNNVVGNTASINVCPTTTTTYTAQVVHTNCNGSQVTVTDQVVVNVSTLSVTMSANATICTGGNTQLSATATGATSWSWVPATNLSCTTCSNPTANPTATTTYTCYVSNGTCQGQGTVTVTVTPMANANAGPDVSICFGSSTQLNASGGATYSWAPATGLSNPNIANPVASPTTTTTYTVYVVTSQGCQGNDAITVTVDPQITLATAGFSTSCSNTCNGQAVCIPAGGTQPFTYSWAPSGGTNASATGLCAGTYTIFVTDALGCTSTDTAIVNSPAPIVLNTNSTNASCGQPNGQACVVANGGVGPYTYLWTPGNQTASCANNVATGTYTVVVTDFNGCTQQATVNVGNNAGVTASTQSFTNATCFNNCDGTATVTTQGGNAPFTYNWQPSGGTSSTASNLCAGTYTCTVTDVNGCSDTAVVVITQPQQVVVAPSAAVTICTSQCTTLTASAVGGNGVYTYTWMPGNLTGSSVQVCPTATTQYTVTAYDGNSCTSAPQTVNVTVRPPVTVAANGSTTICPGNCTNVTALANGGTGGPYTYTWMPGNLTGTSVQVCPTATTTYTVTASDACSPTVTDTVTVNVTPPPPVTFTVDNSSGCAPICVNFTNTTANTTAWNWTFNGGNPGSSNLQNPGNVCFTSAGTFDVTLQVTTANGCVTTYTNPNMITVYPNPDANFAFSPNPATSLNGTVTFTDLSIGASTWTWLFDNTDPNATSNQQNPQYTYTDSGTYVVYLQVSNQYGCTSIDSGYVQVVPDYTFYMPNAFTPNGDGFNDVLMPKTLYGDPTSFEMYIFDRWGNLIFETKKMTEGWDGKASGGNEVSQEDVYVWKVILRDNLETRHEYVGHVSLIK
jgi:gliding motility-associated-like protein